MHRKGRITASKFKRVYTKMNSELHYADFFVFTSSGVHNSRIYFNKNFWDETLLNLDLFWRTYVAPELLFKNEDEPDRREHKDN